MRLETILDLGRAHGLDLPADTVDGLRPHAQVTSMEPDLMSFIAKFHWATLAMVDYDAVRRIAYEGVEDAHREGIDYIELRFSPWFMAEPHQLSAAGVTEAVIDGARAGARDLGVMVKLIGILSRTHGPEIAQKELDALAVHRDGLTALDLAGDEARFPPELFVSHFAQARDLGWRVTVHAGEAAGPESVWTALRSLGAERIGHGVRAQEDPALMAHLRTEGIGLEMCLTSNVQTSTVPSLDAHPGLSFLREGLVVTLNTDDPGISGIDLPHEYRVAAPQAGWTPEDLSIAQANALAVAFIDEGERTTLRRRAAERRTPSDS